MQINVGMKAPPKKKNPTATMVMEMLSKLSPTSSLQSSIRVIHIAACWSSRAIF